MTYEYIFVFENSFRATLIGDPSEGQYHSIWNHWTKEPHCMIYKVFLKFE